ncbi:acyl-CoA dehydrogenase family protein [Amycolatopsis magusensis]|uniref:Alkylation response protein AidB-like acyl-CoA dehydrogenase n=1 Tax=Amycolatopsis magusensis TaxID=882444 RepID=A0ABS4PW12_9PSEU|nr:acyl-CoA dehydrogenase family protein [Amycolatopsis magusensis]MBP2183595.1 alkylation response protein AidB-like acyl-CoA dehydrogenase [Amycolatopsis magusensis]
MTSTRPRLDARSAARTAEDLERFLGDPREPGSRISFRTQLHHDERDEPAPDAFAALREWGLHRYFVPEADGGGFRDIDELFTLFRVLSRRDMTPALSLAATFLACLPTWGWGSASQRARVAELVGSGALGTFGLSEPDHGCDVTAAELTAEPHGDGYLLSGTKWPVGNGTRGAFATIFARTGAAGPRGFSAFLVEKAALDPARWSPEHRALTLGLRGADVSGINFDRCPVPASALIGLRGHGLDEAIKTLQLSRVLVTGMCLGAADTGLRVTLDHIRSRVLYGRTVHELPVIREQVLAAYADLLIADCVTAPANRAFSVAPERQSLWSSVTKYLVPMLTDDALGGLSAVLAARHYLREGVADGMFQKLLRDNRIVSVFEGTSQVHQHVVATQLPSLLTGRDPEHELLSPLFSRTEAPVGWDLRFDRFQLSNGGADEITRCRPAELDGTGPAWASLRVLAGSLDRARSRLHQEATGLLRAERTLTSTARGFGLARRHCLLHAAACCLHTLLANRGSGFLGEPEWAVLCLQRILTRLGAEQFLDPACVPVVEAEMLRCWREGALFSLTPLAIADPREPR